jgi:hypothetical protein
MHFKPTMPAPCKVMNQLFIPMRIWIRERTSLNFLKIPPPGIIIYMNQTQPRAFQASRSNIHNRILNSGIGKCPVRRIHLPSLLGSHQALPSLIRRLYSLETPRSIKSWRREFLNPEIPPNCRETGLASSLQSRLPVPRRLLHRASLAQSTALGLRVKKSSKVGVTTSMAPCTPFCDTPYQANCLSYFSHHCKYHNLPFQCPSCPARQATKREFNRHINSIHVRTEKYYCTVSTCNRSLNKNGKPFSREDGCRKHMRTKHRVTDDQAVTCGMDEETKRIRRQRKVARRVVT